MLNFDIYKKLSYDDIICKLDEANIKFYIDKSGNIVLLENKNPSLVYPHKMFITKKLSLFIDRYCSYNIYNILSMLLILYAIGILTFINEG